MIVERCAFLDADDAVWTTLTRYTTDTLMLLLCTDTQLLASSQDRPIQLGFVIVMVWYAVVTS